MIFIIDNDPKLCAKALDDISLEMMIKDIAQVLCQVHYRSLDDMAVKNKMMWIEKMKNIPLKPVTNLNLIEWSQWARECKANYLYLVEFGYWCDYEFYIRFNKLSKYTDAIHWAKDNVPSLPALDGYGYIIPVEWKDEKIIGCIQKLPLVMPKKYLLSISYVSVIELMDSIENNVDEWDVVESYRNYYQAKLKQRKSKSNQSKKGEI